MYRGFLLSVLRFHVRCLLPLYYLLCYLFNGIFPFKQRHTRGLLLGIGYRLLRCLDALYNNIAKIFYISISHTANWEREYCFLGVCRLESRSSKPAKSEFQAYKIRAI